MLYTLGMAIVAGMALAAGGTRYARLRIGAAVLAVGMVGAIPAANQLGYLLISKAVAFAALALCGVACGAAMRSLGYSKPEAAKPETKPNSYHRHAEPK